MTQEECCKMVRIMRDAYAKQINIQSKSKKKNEYPFDAGICLFMLAYDNKWLGIKNRIEILGFIMQYTGFRPTDTYWFPCGHNKKRLDLMNKAIANYNFGKNHE